MREIVTEGLSSDFDDDINRYEPVLARNAAGSWPLLESLSKPEEIDHRIGVVRDLLGDSQVRFTLLPARQDGDIGLGDDLRANFRLDDRITPASMFLDEVARLVREPTGECAYAAAILLDEFPRLAARVPRFDSIAGRALWHRLVWIGSGRHVVDLHYDSMLNFITVFEGVKRVTLLPPESLPYVYPAPLHRTVGGVPRSLVKVLNVDWDRYPRFEEALALARVATVRPGDVLFIPPLWWHYVESYGFNVMVNAWYTDGSDDVQKKISAADRELRRSIVRIHDAKLDKDAARQLASRLDAANGTGDSGVALESIGPGDDPVEQTVLKGRAILAALPEYWREWYLLQFRYYVCKTFGDPYPTLPGALTEVVRHIRYSRLMREWNRALRFPGRVKHYLGKNTRRLLATARHRAAKKSPSRPVAPGPPSTRPTAE